MLPFQDVIVRRYQNKARPKPDGQTPNSESLCLMSEHSLYLHSFQLCWLQHTSFSWDSSFSVSSFPRQVSNGSGLWHLLHVGVFKATSISLLHAVASQGLYAGTPLPHIWPTWFFLVREGYSIIPSILESKARATWLKLPSSVPCWGWNMASSFSYSFTSFLFSMISFTA